MSDPTARWSEVQEENLENLSWPGEDLASVALRTTASSLAPVAFDVTRRISGSSSSSDWSRVFVAVVSVEGSSGCQSRSGPRNQRVPFSSPAATVLEARSAGVFSGRDVVPLAWTRSQVDLVDSVGHVDVEALGLVGYVAKDYLPV